MSPAFILRKKVIALTQDDLKRGSVSDPDRIIWDGEPVRDNDIHQRGDHDQPSITRGKQRPSEVVYLNSRFK